MGRNLVETLMGAVVLAVAAIFIVFAYSRADLGEVKGYTLSARFDRVDGVKPGADVRISGIKVGSVLSQRLDPDTFLAEIRMSIDPSVKLPDDSAVKILLSGLLGDTYLSISPGGSDDLLKDGGQFQYTQGSVDIISLVGQAVFGKAGGEGEGGAKTPAPDGGPK
jgi:phospholipid/cholesterol/gamma-HCH transport system substrate-binding protein